MNLNISRLSFTIDKILIQNRLDALDITAWILLKYVADSILHCDFHINFMNLNDFYL